MQVAERVSLSQSGASKVSHDGGSIQTDPRQALDESARAIAALLAPKRGVAFVGSVDTSASAALQYARYGDIEICPVNPKGGTAGGLTVYPSMLDVPDSVELAVVKVGAARVAGVIEDCARRGIGQALVFSDGFAEAGESGRRHEQALVDAIARTGVRVLGPNTNDNSFERFPEPANHRGRKIAVVTQSGANGRSVVEGVAMGAAIHRWITTGNEADLEVADFINYFASVEEVGVIAAYVEGFKDAGKLKVALERALLARKPVVILKMGETESGARAAASHTGHLAGSDAVINGLFRQYGVIRVDDLDALLETANLLAKLPTDAGVRTVGYSTSGGTSALMAEAAAASGIDMPTLPVSVQDALHELIPANLKVANPIDNGGLFVTQSDQERRLRVFDILAAEPSIDVILMGFNAAYEPISDRLASDVLAWAPTAGKAVVAVWASTKCDTQGYRDLVASGVPIFRSFRKCMRALAAHKHYRERSAVFSPRMPSGGVLSARQSEALAGSGLLDGAAATALLQDAGVVFPAEVLAADAASVGREADRIGYPVVLKLLSSAFPHKTEHGFVRLGVGSREEAQRIAADMLGRARALDPAAAIEGVLVQEQVRGGVEILVGIATDPQFGPVITVGAGGIHAEVLGDVAVRPLPIAESDVHDMIASLRIAPLLDGVRGAAPADKAGLVRLVLQIAALVEASDGCIAELDLNPVLAMPDRIVAVDALVMRSG